MPLAIVWTHRCSASRCGSEKLRVIRITRGMFRINSCSAGGVPLESDAQSWQEKDSAFRALSKVRKNCRQK